MRALSVDLGGTYAVLALVDDRTLTSIQNVELGETHWLALVLPQLFAAIHKLFGCLQSEERSISDFILGFPGIVDTCTNRVAVILLGAV